MGGNLDDQQMRESFAIKNSLQKAVKDRAFLDAIRKLEHGVSNDKMVTIRHGEKGEIMMFVGERVEGSNIPTGSSINLEYYMDESVRGEDGNERYDTLRQKLEIMARNGVTQADIEELIRQAKLLASADENQRGERDVTRMLRSDTV